MKYADFLRGGITARLGITNAGGTLLSRPIARRRFESPLHLLKRGTPAETLKSTVIQFSTPSICL